MDRYGYMLCSLNYNYTYANVLNSIIFHSSLKNKIVMVYAPISISMIALWEINYYYL